MDRLATAVATLRKELSTVEASVNELQKKIKSLEIEIEKLATGKDVQADISEGEQSRDCVSAIMAKTTILNSDEAKVRHVRQLYDILYSRGELMTSVLMFLSKDSVSLAIRFDCDSDHLGNLQSTFASLTGALLDGRRLQNHADCSEGRVVVSMAALETPVYSRNTIVGRLARTLARAALHAAFGNGGLPYSRSDVERQSEFRSIVENVGGSYSANSCESMKWALQSDSQDVREMGLICAVPEIVAENGDENGRKILFDQFPELLQFYEKHILTKLVK